MHKSTICDALAPDEAVVDLKKSRKGGEEDGDVGSECGGKGQKGERHTEIDRKIGWHSLAVSARRGA